MNFTEPNIILISSNLIMLTTLLLAMSFYLAQAQPSNDTLTSLGPSLINLAISDITLEESATGLTSVNGIVINNSSENVENVKVDVKIYDNSSNVLRETSRFITNPFTVFEPGSTENFSFLMSVENFHNFTAKTYADRIQ